MKSFFAKLFSVSPEVSMMRFGAFIVLILVSIFCLVISGILVYLGFKCSDVLNSLEFWGGISMFVGTLLLNTGVFFGVKAYQKKYEQTNILDFKNSAGSSSPSDNTQQPG